MIQPSATRPVDTRQGIHSLEQGVRLLDVLATATGPLTLRDLAANAGMSASKAHRYLVSLMRCNLVHQDPLSQRYDLGRKALTFGLASIGRLDALRFATEAIIELNQRLDVMALISVWSDRGPTVISLYNRSQLVLTNLAVGAVLPLLRSASGHVFLSYLPPSFTEKMIPAALKKAADSSPPSSIRRRADVVEVITQVRSQGYSMTFGDLVPGRRVIAAPIFNHQNVLVAVAAIIAVPDPADFYIGELIASAKSVSESLGHVAHERSSISRSAAAATRKGAVGAKRKPRDVTTANDAI